MRINPLMSIDFYKADHRRQYPKGTELVYSNFTCRSDKLFNVPRELGIYDGKVVVFGIQYFIKDFLIGCWDKGFFDQPKNKVVAQYKRRLDLALGKDAVPVDHIEALHDLGYLPLAIKALPEGTLCPIGVPLLVIYNTHPDFFWLTNYVETVMSCYIWKPITSATIALCYKKLLTKYAKETGSDLGFVNFQGHDFSFRGMSCIEDAAVSGAAHLTSFFGTDSVLSLDFLEDYYNANAEIEFLGGSVPASEHSVMCMSGKDDEIGTFRRFITELYPTGIVSIVSDTWDFWKTIGEYSQTLHQEIMSRNGKLVFRPDSGDPVKIICGDLDADLDSLAYKGAIEVLWDIFGGTANDQGYKTLDSHVGLIYGDSITIDRAYRILEGLKAKGFSSGNIVFGIGSYTYQYVTRDTFGSAIKATYGIVNGERRALFKDPITDGGTKKSAKGLLCVLKEDGILKLRQDQELIDMYGDELLTVFKDGELLIDYSIDSIRKRINNG